MSDTSIAIKVAGDDTKAHAAAIAAADEAWVKELTEAGKTVRIRIPADADTEGHESSSVLTVLVGADDDDVEGHALSLHFPSVQEANDFRRNLLAAGLITATLAVGAAGGMAIGTAASIDANDTTIAVSQYEPNLGQYDPANMGGTAAAIQGGSSLGQADVNNMGGTVVPASSLGGADVNNMGGTIAPASSLGGADVNNMGGTIAPASSLGGADVNNMGGTVVPASSLGQADPTNMGGTIAPASSLGGADANNMGGTPQAGADEEDDAPQLPPGI
jgi:hypothetical protein